MGSKLVVARDCLGVGQVGDEVVLVIKGSPEGSL
jgi:hypothetical protein